MTDEEAKRFGTYAAETIRRIINRHFVASFPYDRIEFPRPEVDIEDYPGESYWAFMNINVPEEELDYNDESTFYCSKEFQESHTYAEAIALLKEWVEFEVMLTSPIGNWRQTNIYE